jgi:hypothetical protein
MPQPTKKELQDWRATLTKDEDKTVEQMIQEQGEDNVLSILGHLKNDFDNARVL